MESSIDVTRSDVCNANRSCRLPASLSPYTASTAEAMREPPPDQEWANTLTAHLRRAKGESVNAVSKHKCMHCMHACMMG